MSITVSKYTCIYNSFIYVEYIHAYKIAYTAYLCVVNVLE